MFIKLFLVSIVTFLLSNKIQIIIAPYMILLPEQQV